VRPHGRGPECAGPSASAPASHHRARHGQGSGRTGQNTRGTRAPRASRPQDEPAGVDARPEITCAGAAHPGPGWTQRFDPGPLRVGPSGVQSVHRSFLRAVSGCVPSPWVRPVLWGFAPRNALSWATTQRFGQALRRPCRQGGNLRWWHPPTVPGFDPGHALPGGLASGSSVLLIARVASLGAVAPIRKSPGPPGRACRIVPLPCHQFTSLS